jgi:hypothetical protein
MRSFDHPENLFRNKHPMMFHTSGFAIAAGVVAVGSAAASGAVAMSAADRAAKAQGAAGGAYKKQLKKATDQFIKQQDEVKAKIAAIDPNLNIPEYNLKGATKESIDVANQITANTLKQIENIVPGSAQARAQVMQSLGQWENNLNQQYRGLQANQGLIDQQRGVVGSMLRGELTPVQQEQINRVIAERGGAGFNPATAGRAGGFQTAQAQLADQLRQSSEARILAGMQLAPGVNEQQRGLAGSSIALSEGFRGLQNTMGTWMSLADAWKQNVPQVMGIGLQGRGQDIQVKQYGIQNALEQQGLISQINQGNYGAMTGQAQGIYGVNKDTAAANYANTMAGSSAIQGVGSAAAGGLMGMSYASAAKQGLGGMGGYGGYGNMGGAGGYVNRVSNPNLQYLGGGVDTMTDIYKGPRLTS